MQYKDEDYHVPQVIPATAGYRLVSGYDKETKEIFSDAIIAWAVALVDNKPKGQYASFYLHPLILGDNNYYNADHNPIQKPDGNYDIPFNASNVGPIEVIEHLDWREKMDAKQRERAEKLHLGLDD